MKGENKKIKYYDGTFKKGSLLDDISTPWIDIPLNH
jgi:hypothetical protein